jgi:hypothetical protein
MEGVATSTADNTHLVEPNVLKNFIYSSARLLMPKDEGQIPGGFQGAYASTIHCLPHHLISDALRHSRLQLAINITSAAAVSPPTPLFYS